MDNQTSERHLLVILVVCVDTYPEALEREDTGAGGDAHEEKYRSIGYTSHTAAPCFMCEGVSRSVFSSPILGGLKDKKL